MTAIPLKNGNMDKNSCKAIHPLCSLWHNGFMSSQNQKENFEHYLQNKSAVYFQEKSTLNEAILYSLLAPGKRVRPLLSVGFSQGFKGNSEIALSSGMAVEM